MILLESPSCLLVPERIFPVAAIVFGVVFALLTPPFQAPDENVHFFRAWQLASGNTRSIVPEDLRLFAARYKYLRFAPQNKMRYALWVSEWSVKKPCERGVSHDRVPYSIVLPYLPQAVGVAIGRTLWPSPILGLYLGRIFNLACYIALILGALRVTPVGRWTLCLLALMPMSLFLAASLSYDALLIASSFAFTACVLAYSLDHARTRGPWLVAPIWGITLMLGLQKPGYALLVGLIILPVITRKGSRRAAMLLMMLCLITAVTCQWIVHSRALLRPCPESSSFVPSVPSVAFALKFANTLISLEKWKLYVGSFSGCLGWLDTLIYPPFLLGLYTMLLLSCVSDKPKPFPTPISWIYRGFLLGIPLLLFIFLHWAMYRYETGLNPPEYLTIEGIQGRYLIPVAFSALVGCTEIVSLPKCYRKHARFLMSSYSLFLLCVTVLTLWQRYYGEYWWHRSY